MEFVGLRPKMYRVVKGNHVIHPDVKGVFRNVVIDRERMSLKNIELQRCAPEAESRKEKIIENSIHRITN